MEEMTLTAEELYFACTKLNGAHLNYEYIALMPDISQEKLRCEETCMEALDRKGIMCESLFEDMDVADWAMRLFSPIFFGDAEASLGVFDMSRQAYLEKLLFHWKGSQGTRSKINGEAITFSPVEQSEMEEVAVSLLPFGYATSDPPRKEVAMGTEADRVLVLKSIRMGQNATVNVYFDFDGWLYEQQSEQSYRALGRAEFIEKATAILKGAV
jgi:hypothetical protein